MSTEQTYPYSLEVLPVEISAEHFQWLIRERGKLIQRSDRLQPSEDKAREKGQVELERLFFGRLGRRQARPEDSCVLNRRTLRKRAPETRETARTRSCES